LTLLEARQLRAALTYDNKAIARDLIDLIDFMLATGLRIGEATAVLVETLDQDTGTVQVRGTVVRIRGEGLIIKPEPKTEAGIRTLKMPSWCVTMLRRRLGDLDLRTGDPVFPASFGGLRDPSNTQADMREAFRTAGFDWLTSHILRKTVATLIDKAGHSARAAADQLGHANPTMTQNVYYGRDTIVTIGATTLEPLDFNK
jgi:integrase